MIPDEVLQTYSCDPKTTIIEPISVGLIHQTYKVTDGEGRYIFQSLNPILATQEIASDMEIVTEHIVSKGITSPIMVRNQEGGLLTKMDDVCWRVQTCLDGESYELIKDGDMAFELGKQLGVFHAALSDVDYDFKSARKNHPTKDYLHRFEQVLSGADLELLAVVEREVTYLQDRIKKLLLPDNLSLAVIHGDPKISNFLFKDGKASATVDLDTCGRASVLYDLGDAFRSWCGGLEDDPNNSFNIEHFTQGLRGYMSQNKLPQKEVSLLLQSVELITLELAMRFCTDYFEDSYFSYDKERYPNRKAHNLARTRGQIALHKSIVVQREEIEEVIKKFI